MKTGVNLHKAFLIVLFNCNCILNCISETNCPLYQCILYTLLRAERARREHRGKGLTVRFYLMLLDRRRSDEKEIHLIFLSLRDCIEAKSCILSNAWINKAKAWWTDKNRSEEHDDLILLINDLKKLENSQERMRLLEMTAHLHILAIKRNCKRAIHVRLSR